MKNEIDLRKKTEEALRNSERDYRGLFKNAHDAIIIFNPKTKRIIDSNQQARTIYGYSKDEIIGLSIEALLGPDGLPLYLESMKSSQDTGFELENLKKDGSKIYVGIKASAINYKDQGAILQYKS